MPTNLEIFNEITNEEKTAEETAVGMMLSEVVTALIELHDEGEMPIGIEAFDTDPYIRKFKAVVQWLNEEKK